MFGLCMRGILLCWYVFYTLFFIVRLFVFLVLLLLLSVSGLFRGLGGEGVFDAISRSFQGVIHQFSQINQVGILVWTRYSIFVF